MNERYHEILKPFRDIVGEIGHWITDRIVSLDFSYNEDERFGIPFDDHPQVAGTVEPDYDPLFDGGNWERGQE